MQQKQKEERHDGVAQHFGGRMPRFSFGCGQVDQGFGHLV
jgi:hypothetical protein